MRRAGCDVTSDLVRSSRYGDGGAYIAYGDGGKPAECPGTAALLAADEFIARLPSRRLRVTDPGGFREVAREDVAEDEWRYRWASIRSVCE